MWITSLGCLLMGVTVNGGSLRNDYPPGWPFLGHCLEPNAKGGLNDFDVQTCAAGTEAPFKKDSKIAIVGGGPAGVSMARLLHDRGFKRITLYEKNDRLGGKSKSFKSSNGDAHELGTCYLAGKYECIEQLVEDVGLTEVAIDQSRYISSATTPKMSATGAPDMSTMLNPPEYGTVSWWAAMKAYQLDNSIAPQKFYATFVAAVSKYNEEWHKTMGDNEYMFPSDENNVDFSALNQTFLSWLTERNLLVLVPRLHVSTGGQGYGRLDSMPAFYGLTWNHPNLVSGSKHNMIKEGFEALWQGMLTKTNVVVKLGSEVTRIERDETSKKTTVVHKYIDGSKKSEVYDFLIMAAPMPDALALLDYTHKELELFSSFRYHELVANIMSLDSAGTVVPPNFELFSWVERLDAQTDFSIRTFAPTTGAVASQMTAEVDGVEGPLTIRHTSNIKDSDQDVIGVLQITSTATTNTVLDSLIQKDLLSYGFKASMLHRERWPNFMPFSDLNQVANERKPWRVWKNQGKKRTWFVGSYVSFESVADVLDYNFQLIQKKLCVPTTTTTTTTTQSGPTTTNLRGDKDKISFSWEKADAPSCPHGFWTSGCGQSASTQTGDVVCVVKGEGMTSKISSPEKCIGTKPAPMTRHCPKTPACPVCKGCKRNGDCWKTCGGKAGLCSACNSAKGTLGACCLPGNENDPVECQVAAPQLFSGAKNVHTCALLPSDSHVANLVKNIFNRLEKIEGQLSSLIGLSS